jgi:hypothetical protein
MEASDSFAEVNLYWHLFIFRQPIAHKFSSYRRISAGVAPRAEMRRMLIVTLPRYADEHH